MTLVDIADKGDPLETLKRLRHDLAEAIDNSNSGRDIAALSRQLQMVMISISDLEEQKDNTSEEIEDLIRSNSLKRVR